MTTKLIMWRGRRFLDGGVPEGVGYTVGLKVTRYHPMGSMHARIISVYFRLNLCKLYDGPIRLLTDHDFTVRCIQVESIARGRWMVPLIQSCTKIARKTSSRRFCGLVCVMLCTLILFFVIAGTLGGV